MFSIKSLWNLLLVGVLGLGVLACDNDDDMVDPLPEPMNIAEIAAADDNLSTLVGALQRVDLVAVLEGDGPFTVFAPTNQAFEDLGVDLNTLSDEALEEILLYHVLGGQVASTDLAEGQTYATTAAQTGPGDTQLSVLIEKASNGTVTVNGLATVTGADISATNGVIHVVDQVLLPLSVVGHASANSEFSTLVSALGDAEGDLVGVLSGDGPFTVFAPLNSAFEAIATTVASLDNSQLASVLTYHVLSGNILQKDITDGLAPTTIQGETFTLNINGSDVTITDANGGVANVVLTNVQGTNGVIHVLDAVIIPQNL